MTQDLAISSPSHPVRRDDLDARTDALAQMLRSRQFEITAALQLIEAGVDVTAARYSVEDYRSATLLHIAAYVDCLPVCIALVKAGASRDVKAVKHNYSDFYEEYRDEFITSKGLSDRHNKGSPLNNFFCREAAKWGCYSDVSVYMKERNSDVGGSILRIFNFQAQECTRIVNDHLDATQPFEQISAPLIDKAIRTAQEYGMDIDPAAVPRKAATGVVIVKKKLG